jgi:uncharacterized protein YbbC (DUF1343 family)/CubicO group peptidase (beta-lactamase class C family)
MILTSFRLLAGGLLLATISGGPAIADPPFAASPLLDSVIEEAIREDQIPGAVLVVGQPGKTLHRAAYGVRSLTPAQEKMTLETVFDVASLTKVVATTSAMMKLVEMGKVRLNDPLTVYLPEYQKGKTQLTVRSLLTHFSGLRPDVDLKPAWSGYQTGVRLALIDKPVAEVGERFIYSDINFVLLGEIVRRLAREPLPDFVHKHVFAPLGMNDTRFTPPPSWRARIAPTEMLPGTNAPLRGVVHDPTTRYMGGIAGHAGLFSTAADLEKFAEMMLGNGERNGVRIFSPATVEKFTTPQSPPDQPILRGLGWDIDSPFSGNRGELFPIGSYGHTGFTGTSMWIDPTSRTFVILLCNSGHPQLRKPITPLRGKVATVTAAGLGLALPGIALTGYNETLTGAGVRRQVARNGQVFTGLDVMVEQRFAPLQKLRVGLITNHTGIDRTGKRNIDRMKEAGVDLQALFSPEHGIFGTEDREDIGDTRDASTGLKVWSLYKEKGRRPTPEMLRDLDALVFDIQDIGTRFYTYTTTMAYAMEEAAKRRIPFFVFDRPNPITGVHMEGPMLQMEAASFVGYFPMPLRHAMTMGEMVRMFNLENKIGADLRVIPMRGWERGDWFDSTGLLWVNPSPNMRSLNAALLYPGVAMLEYSQNYSVGRGTEAPFEQVGAPWIGGRELASHLNARKIPGVRVYPTRFRPDASNFQGQWVEGVRFVITDRESFNSMRMGLELAAAFEKLYPGTIQFHVNERLMGDRQVIGAITKGEDPRNIVTGMQEAMEAFAVVRKKYLLY